MVRVSRQDNIFVGKRVTPLLHLRWTAIVDVHLIILGGGSTAEFEELTREAILRNIGARVPPPLAGAIPPGAVCLFNTMDKLDKLYTWVIQELDKCDSPNTRMGQRLVAWLNRYLGDMDHTMRAKPSKKSHHISCTDKMEAPCLGHVLWQKQMRRVQEGAPGCV